MDRKNLASERKTAHIYLSYCTNVKFSIILVIEMKSEISNICSSTDHLIYFGDYNINLFRENGNHLLNNFSEDNELQYLNTKKASCTTGGRFSLINFGFISEKHFFETDIIESILENNHFTIVYQIIFEIGL